MLGPPITRARPQLVPEGAVGRARRRPKEAPPPTAPEAPGVVGLVPDVPRHRSGSRCGPGAVSRTKRSQLGRSRHGGPRGRSSQTGGSPRGRTARARTVRPRRCVRSIGARPVARCATGGATGAPPCHRRAALRREEWMKPFIDPRVRSGSELERDSHGGVGRWWWRGRSLRLPSPSREAAQRRTARPQPRASTSAIGPRAPPHSPNLAGGELAWREEASGSVLPESERREHEPPQVRAGQLRRDVRGALLGGSRALQHRSGRVRQAPARQARDGLLGGLSVATSAAG